MKRQWASLLLCAVLLMELLSGCGGGTASPDSAGSGGEDADPHARRI